MKLIYTFLFLTISSILGNAQQIEFVTDLHQTVNETSGIVFLNDKLITHNDSGGQSALYELDSSGNITRTVVLNNASNVDWEDICYDETYIYVADFGNNDGSRTDLKVYRISISDYFDNDDTVNPDIIHFSYADQTDFNPPDKTTNFDAEALISFESSLYIFTKNWSDNKTNIYTLPKTPGNYQIEKIDSIDLNYDDGLVTGATYNALTNTILLTGYTYNIFVNAFIIEVSDFNSNNFSDGTIKRYTIQVPSGYSRQIEGIASLNYGQYYLTAEEYSTLSWNSGLYKLETDGVASTDKYRLMFNSNPSTEVTIAWDQISGSGQKVYYGTTDHGTDYESYPYNISPYRSTDYLDMSNQFVKLKGLTPDTKYYFVIKNSEGTSERFWFRTIPDDNNKRLSIISGGDSRTEREYRQNSNRMVAKLRPHAVLFGGDLIARPGEGPDTMANWLDDWQLTITSDNQIIPTVHSYGNHESDPPEGDLLTLHRLFDTPEDSYYNVKFGGDLFSYYVLNGELLPNGYERDDNKRIEQRNWLQSSLPADNSIWKTAGYHRPIAPHNSGKTAESDYFNDWANTFYDHGVRVVMESDAHLVKLTEELKPVSTTAIGDDPENWFTTSDIEDDKGFTFIGGGSWGVIRVADRSYSYTIASKSDYAFNLLFVDKCGIEVRTINTQNPDSVTEKTESTRFDLTSDLESVVWKPSGLPTGAIEINKKNTIWEGSSWVCGEPNSEKNATINADYNHSSGNIEAKNLTINSGVELNFDNVTDTDNSVIVHGDLSIEGVFTIGDTESLVMIDDNATIAGEITKFENSTPRVNDYDITYWSSPVEDEIIGNVFTGVDQDRIFYHDQNQSTAISPDSIYDPDGTYWNVWQVAGQSDIMISGHGFAAEGEDGSAGVHSIDFTGKPGNGEVTYIVKGYTDDDLENDYQLVGNPYPSAINTDEFFTVNTNVIQPLIYLWTHNTPVNDDTGDFVSSDYAYYNLSGGTAAESGGNIPSGNICSGQGFFVQAINSGNIIFNNSMRIERENDQFFKHEEDKNFVEKDRTWLNLTTNQGGFSQILVGFFNQATDVFDRSYDAKRIYGDNPINFYSQIDEEKFVIQGLSSFTQNKTVSLGFDTKSADRTFKINIDKTEGKLKDTEIFLVDNFLNSTHNLSVKEYEFNQEVAGKFPNRFTLQFVSSALGVDELKNDYSFTISNNYAGFKINTSKPVVEIKVYDMLGRLLLQNNPNRNSFNLNADNIKDGTILVVKVAFENDINLSKRIIKY